MHSSLISVADASKKWGISSRRIQYLCNEGRIEGVIRIGKTWLIPITAEKPEDGRIKTVPKIETKRHKMKLLVKRIILDLYNQRSKDNSKMAAYHTLSYYAAFILITCENKKQDVFGSCELSFVETNIQRIVPEYEPLSDDFNTSCITENYQLLLSNLELLDDSLSWAYQYLKKYLATVLGSTQFFTDNYMISTLTDPYHFSIDDKIVDPSCGGGNFLVYVLKKKIQQNEKEFAKNPIKTISNILRSLWGYDLDDFLSLLSAFNLIINASRILTGIGIPVDLKTITQLETNIYTSSYHNVGGFLDYTNLNHEIYNVMNGTKVPFRCLVEQLDYIFTNPPFQTIKGMDAELKTYLKSNIPACNCDLCIAFLLKITECLPDGATCGLVLQNSWMYLSSFEDVRLYVKKNYKVDSIIILGSSAFTDISGEKASVSLTTIIKDTPNDDECKIMDIASLKRDEKESLLIYGEKQWILIPQSHLFETSSNPVLDPLPKLAVDFPQYSNYATPMQATSTGDSKRLVDYYWLHIGNDEWKLVSKGGGYARWAGLTRYVVRWGANGEYIRSTPGSALRNIQYFGQTQLVYSDTGTSGLNVRLLLKDQIFIASGPGIRIHSGDQYAHLAFLNSRYVSYCVKKYTPKLTIAAGYISKIPINPELIQSKKLSELGLKCLRMKETLLSCCPTTVQFTGVMTESSIDKNAMKLLIDHISIESKKLQLEREVDSIIYSAMSLTKDQINEIETYLCITSDESLGYPSVKDLDEMAVSIINDECSLSKTKVNRNGLGCDGWLEYLANYYSIEPQKLSRIMIDNSDLLVKLKKKYTDLVCHNLVLNSLQYPNKDQHSIGLEQIIAIIPLDNDDRKQLTKWIIKDFNKIHCNIMLKKPLYKYDKIRNTIVSMMEDIAN